MELNTRNDRSTRGNGKGKGNKEEECTAAM